MRIGLLTTFLALGESSDSGIGQHYLILADALAAQGHQVHLVHPTLKPEAATTALAALAPRWSYEVVPVRTPGWLDRLLTRSWPSRVLLAEIFAARAADRALHRAAQTHSLEIVETHATASPALFYLQRRDRPAVVTRVSTTMSQMNATNPVHSRVKEWQAAIERCAVHASDALVTHTASHRDAICALDGYSRSQFALVPHGLPDAPERTEAPASDGVLEILFVGRFEHRKGIDVLLQAIPAVLQASPQVRFTLAGSTGDGVAWADFARRHPDLVGQQVFALGRVSADDLDRLYARGDILVAPSRYESFGLIYVEAMRRAKPVVGCRVGGIPDVVEHGVSGLLVPPGDASALADSLIRLLSEPALRTRLGNAGQADFRRRFSDTAMATASVEFYQSVVDHAAGITL